MRLNFVRTDETASYDIVLAVCGYEARASTMLDLGVAGDARKVAVSYDTQHVLSFASNLERFESAGFECPIVGDDEFTSYVRGLIDSSSSNDAPVRMLVDISCMTRLRLAQLMEVLFSVENFDLDVYYCLAEYTAPASEEPKYEHLCPVSEHLSGWGGDASKAVVMVSGLGYEQMAAIGIMEHIDPYDVWLFFPESPVAAYDKSVANANSLILEDVSPSNVIRYPVLRADVIMSKLFVLVDSLRVDYRCILMPLGPKIFAFASILAGCYFGDVSVWRASAGRHTRPKERSSSGMSERFRVQLRSDPEIRAVGADEHD